MNDLKSIHAARLSTANNVAAINTICVDFQQRLLNVLCSSYQAEFAQAQQIAEERLQDLLDHTISLGQALVPGTPQEFVQTALPSPHSLQTTAIPKVNPFIFEGVPRHNSPALTWSGRSEPSASPRTPINSNKYDHLNDDSTFGLMSSADQDLGLAESHAYMFGSNNASIQRPFVDTSLSWDNTLGSTHTPSLSAHSDNSSINSSATYTTTRALHTPHNDRIPPSLRSAHISMQQAMDTAESEIHHVDIHQQVSSAHTYPLTSADVVPIVPTRARRSLQQSAIAAQSNVIPVGSEQQPLLGMASPAEHDVVALTWDESAILDPSYWSASQDFDFLDSMSYMDSAQLSSQLDRPSSADLHLFDKIENSRASKLNGEYEDDSAEQALSTSTWVVHTPEHLPSPAEVLGHFNAQLGENKLQVSLLLTRLFYAIGSPDAVRQLRHASDLARRSFLPKLSHGGNDLAGTIHALDQLDSMTTLSHILRRYYLVRLLKHRSRLERDHNAAKQAWKQSKRRLKYDCAKIDLIRKGCNYDQLQDANKNKKRPNYRSKSQALADLMHILYPGLEPKRHANGFSTDCPYSRKLAKLKNRLSCARNWYQFEQIFSIGVLALIPCAGKFSISIDQVEKLPSDTLRILLDYLKRQRGPFLESLSHALSVQIYNVLTRNDLDGVFRFEAVEESMIEDELCDTEELVEFCSMVSSVTDLAEPRCQNVSTCIGEEMTAGPCI